MTDETETNDPAGTETMPPPNPPTRWRRFWRGFVMLSRREITVDVRTVAGCAAILLLGGLAIVHMIQEVDRRQREAAAFLAATEVYRNELRAYDNEVSSREFCLGSVERGDLNRAQWELAAFLLGELGEGAREFGARLAEGPLLQSEPLEVSDCPTVGKVPEPPPQP